MAQRPAAGRVRRGQNARDLDIINEHAEALNAEEIDVLSYQVIP